MLPWTLWVQRDLFMQCNGSISETSKNAVTGKDNSIEWQVYSAFRSRLPRMSFQHESLAHSEYNEHTATGNKYM